MHERRGFTEIFNTIYCISTYMVNVFFLQNKFDIFRLEKYLIFKYLIVVENMQIHVLCDVYFCLIWEPLSCDNNVNWRYETVTHIYKWICKIVLNFGKKFSAMKGIFVENVSSSHEECSVVKIEIRNTLFVLTVVNTNMIMI